MGRTSFQLMMLPIGFGGEVPEFNRVQVRWAKISNTPAAGLHTGFLLYGLLNNFNTNSAMMVQAGTVPRFERCIKVFPGFVLPTVRIAQSHR